MVLRISINFLNTLSIPTQRDNYQILTCVTKNELLSFPTQKNNEAFSFPEVRSMESLKVAFPDRGNAIMELFISNSVN